MKFDDNNYIYMFSFITFCAEFKNKNDNLNFVLLIIDCIIFMFVICFDKITTYIYKK